MNRAVNDVFSSIVLFETIFYHSLTKLPMGKETIVHAPSHYENLYFSAFHSVF